jgi:WD40 repeat protein/tRNA A-37 threonylcarbamoyl transferase component Bud32
MAEGADRNLLFGILALQLDFINRDSLIEAMNVWVLHKQRELADILVERGALRGDNRDLLAALVARHLEQHGNDPQRSLESLGAPSTARRQLESIGDVDLLASLVYVPLTQVDPDVQATRNPSTGSAPASARRFRILRPHARGGLGTVSVAFDEELRREVALKEIQSEQADHLDRRARFLLEAEITGGLEHPGIVPVYGLGTYADGRPYYAMRFIRGDSLHEAIRRFHRDGPRDPGERRLALRQLLGRFVDVCDAIAYAHSRGILHRDLKPGNIMLGKYGETLVVDWGLAKMIAGQQPAVEEPPLQPTSVSEVGSTRMGEVVGTPAFMPPEQAAGRLDLLGPASDVYSLGATLHTLLTGRAPFEEGDARAMLARVERGEFAPPRQVQPEVDPALEAISLKAMALRPEDRYPTPRALVDDIEHWLADEPVGARRENWSRRLARWGRRHRAWVQAGAVGVFLLAVGGVAASLLINEQRHKAVELSQSLDREKGETEKALADTRRLAGELTEEGKRTRTALEESERRSARLALDRGIRVSSDRNVAEGMLWLARGLQHALAARDADLERVLRLNLANWRRLVMPLRQTVASTHPIRDLVVSPDSRRFATASHNGDVLLWESATGQVIGQCQLPKNVKAGAILFAPDSRTLVVGADDQSVTWWQVDSGKSAAAPLMVEGKVRALSFSRNGEMLLVAAGKAARLWDVRTRMPLGPPLVHEEELIVAVLTPDGKSAVTAGRDTSAHIWDPRTGKETILKHDNPISQVLLSADGVWAVTIENLDLRLRGGRSSGTAHVWETATGQRVGQKMVHPNVITCATLSPDGQRLLTGCADRVARMWDVAGGTLIGLPMPHFDLVRCVAFAPGGNLIATGTGVLMLGQTQVWDTETGLPLGSPLAQANQVRQAEFTPDGKRLITTGLKGLGEAGDLRIWEVPPGMRPEKMVRLEGKHGMDWIAPRGTSVLTTPFPFGAGALLGQHRSPLLDTATGKQKGDPVVHKSVIHSADFSVDDRLLATSLFTGVVELRDTTTMKTMASFPSGSTLPQVALLPGGRVVVGVSKKLRIWDPKANTVSLPQPLPDEVIKLDIAADGRRCLVGCFDGKVYLRDLVKGETLGKPFDPGGIPSLVRISPDGRVALTGGSQGPAILWDLVTGNPIGPAMPPRVRHATAWNGAISIDGVLAATEGNDGVVHIWDTRTALPIGPPLRHPQLVNALTFGGQPRELVTTDVQRQARFWELREPVAGSFQDVMLWVEVLTGLELDQKDTIRSLDDASCAERRWRLQNSKGRHVP